MSRPRLAPMPDKLNVDTPQSVIHCGDALEVLQTLEPNSAHSIVTDPPYGLSFMGKEWDHGIPGVAFWEAALRVAKPGAFLLAFGGTRTHHRLMCAIEDAGWEIRDCIMWVYGSGFPKSLDVSKAIDKAAGAMREVTAQGHRKNDRDATSLKLGRKSDDYDITAPSTDAARQWEGWGTALKPAWEPIIVARKPLDGTVAQNALAHETGALNIDGCRVEGAKGSGVWGSSNANCQDGRTFNASIDGESFRSEKSESGRWPANVIHDGSDEVTDLFPDTESGQPAGMKAGGKLNCFGVFPGGIPVTGIGDSGSAARFFYCAKASPEDRQAFNTHPTVKPTDLMRYLCRLVTRSGGTVLDPFCGSGSTGRGAIMEGFKFVGIELNPEYVAMARRRIADVNPSMFQEAP